MPNCVFPQCSVQRIPKYDGIGLFEITRRKGDFYVQWRNNLIAEISRYRVIDKALQHRLDHGKVFICELHFRPEDIEPTGKYSIFYLIYAFTTQLFCIYFQLSVYRNLLTLS